MILLDKTFDPVVKDWFNQVGKPGQANAINRCVKSLRDAGILKELDLFHLIGGLDSDDQRLRPLITTSTTKTFTAVASPTLAYNGVTGNGTTSYINTNWDRTTNGTKFLRNDAHLSVYCRTDTNADTIEFGHSNLYIKTRVSGNLGYRINDASAPDTLTNPSSAGFFYLARTSSTNKEGFKNGSSLGTSSSASTSLDANTIFICCRNNGGSPLNFSTKNISQISLGSSNINQLKFYQIIQQYMTEVGLAV